MKKKTPIFPIKKIFGISFSVVGVFFLIYGFSRGTSGDILLGLIIFLLFAGVPALFYYIHLRKEQKARREAGDAQARLIETKRQQEAKRKAEAEARYAAIEAQKKTYEQLVATRPPIHHFYKKGTKFEAWVSHRRVGEELICINDPDLFAYTFDDDLVVPNSVGQVLDQYPHSQVFVCNINEAPSGTSVDLIINPIR